jgi:parallel beta-helix repeat protein
MQEVSFVSKLIHRGFFSTLNGFSKAIKISQKKSKSAVNDLRADPQFLNNQDARHALPTTHFRSSTAALKIDISTLLGNSRRLRIIPLVAVFFAPMANAATYYVATNGNDSNPGTLSSPWRTIAKAANTLVAGDAVNIRAGTYKEQVKPKNSGTASGFITYAAYPGETVNIDGSNGLNSTWNGIIDLTNRSYLQVSGLHFLNSPGFGIFMSNSSNLRILKNYTYRTSNSGIYMTDSNTLTIDGNEIDTPSSGGDQNNGIQEALSIMASQNITASNNSVHNGGMEGIDAKGSTNVKIFGNNVYDMARVGIYVDCYSNEPLNIEIYNNTVSNSKAANSGAAEDGIRVGAEEGGNVSNVKIYNNVLYNIAQSGIILANWTGSGSEPKFSNISIYNNTTYNTGVKGGGGINIQGSQNSGLTIRNNILSKSKSFNIQSSSGATISNNLFDGGSTNGTSTVAGNPLFINAAGNNFRLQSTSMAINAGTSTGAPTIDFDLQARPQGGQVDIGAFEYGSSSSTTPDTTAPSTPAGLGGTASSPTKVNLSWTASTDNVGVTGYKIYRNGTEIGANAGTSFADSGVVGGTSYNYTVRAQDAAGNLSTVSNTATVKTPTSTGTAVSLSSYSVGTITRNSAIVKWSTNVASTGKVVYGTSAGSLGSQATAGNAATNQSVQLTGLARRTTYYYKITVSNGSATASSPVASFRTSGWY